MSWRRARSYRNRGPIQRLARGVAGLGSAKFHSQARVRTPDDVARLFELVVADHENEIVRNTDLAAHFETGTYPRHIPYAAIDTAGPVKADTAGLEGAPALGFSSFFHCCLRLTETANCTLGPPLYRAVKRIIKRPLKLLEITNQGNLPPKPLIQRGFSQVQTHARAAKEGCPRHAPMHDGADLPQNSKTNAPKETSENEARPLWRTRPREARHHR